jgi:hypothetical protein
MRHARAHARTRPAAVGPSRPASVARRPTGRGLPEHVTRIDRDEKRDESARTRCAPWRRGRCGWPRGGCGRHRRARGTGGRRRRRTCSCACGSGRNRSASEEGDEELAYLATVQVWDKERDRFWQMGRWVNPKFLKASPDGTRGQPAQPRRFIFRPCSTRSALLKRSGSNHRARTARRRRRGRTRGSRKQGEKRAVAGAATGSDGTDGDDGKRQGWVGGNHLLFRDVRVIVVSSRARVAHYSAHVSLVVRSRKLRVRGGARANSEGDEPRPLPVSGVGATKRRRRARRRVGVRQMDAGGARRGVHERVQSQNALGRL